MKMIVGLGNPGSRYARNRHNIGFQVADVLARRHAISLSRSKYNALFGQGTIYALRVPRNLSRLPDRDSSSQQVLIVRPLTFMNLSGNSVAHRWQTIFE